MGGDGDFSMNIRFGRVNVQTIGAIGRISREGVEYGVPQWVIDYINLMLDDIKTLFENQNIMVGNTKTLWDYIFPGDDVHFNKLAVWTRMIIPSWS